MSHAPETFFYLHLVPWEEPTGMLRADWMLAPSA